PRRPKGTQAQAGRPAMLATVKYATAWLYQYARLDWPKRQPQPSHPALVEAARGLAQQIRDWEAYPHPERLQLLTAWNVTRSVPEAWERARLKAPFEPGSEPNPEAFYQTYIQPALSEVDAITRRQPKQLDPKKNAYLRKLLASPGGSTAAIPNK